MSSALARCEPRWVRQLRDREENAASSQCKYTADLACTRRDGLLVGRGDLNRRRQRRMERRRCQHSHQSSTVDGSNP